MSSWEPSLQKQPSMGHRPIWFEAILPVSALPLIIVLMLILPVFILAAESLFAPVFDYVQSLLMPVNAGITYTYLPLELILKIVIFSLFTFTGVALLLLKISCLYHEVWSYFFVQPHPQHTQYHPDQQDSMIALFNWNIFRWYRVLGPFLMWLVITILAAAFFFWLFNAFTDFGFFTFQLQFTLGFFAISVFSFFAAIAFFKGLWAAFTTILGDVAAITEPEKETQVLYERSRKLAFGSPWVFILYPLYFLFYVALFVEIILLLANYDIQDLISFHSSLLTLYGLEGVTFILFLFLSAMKFMTYNDALGRFYKARVD